MVHGYFFNFLIFYSFIFLFFYFSSYLCSPNMKRIYIIIGILTLAMSVFAQEKETPNAQQARRLFMQAYDRMYGQQGSQVHYKVNIIGIYKTEGTIWTKGKKSKFIDERYIAWNDDVTYYRLERKKKTITIYDAHSDERDKYATKFKFSPDNYTYSIKDTKDGYAITLKAKKGVSGIKEARVLLDKKTHNPMSVRIKLGIFHTTIKISEFKTGGITDELFQFPKDRYPAKDYQYIDKR